MRLLTILKINQPMTLLWHVQRVLLKVLPLNVLLINQQMTLLLNVMLMLLKVPPLRTLLIALEILVQWVLTRKLRARDSSMNCCLNDLAEVVRSKPIRPVSRGKRHKTPHFGPFWAYSRTLPQGVDFFV